MNHKRELRLFSALDDTSAPQRTGLGLKRLSLAATALLALGGTGCFRSSGFQETPVVVEAIPEFNGDRVLGLKAMSGPGDYYLGNDFIQVAVDGTRFGDLSQKPIAGAAGGGSIVDAGYLTLDTSYTRVDIPSDSLERLTPIVNQDPSLELVFDTYVTNSTIDPSTLTMTGYLLDPNHRIHTVSGGTNPALGGAASTDSAGRVLGVSVTHTLSLGKLDRFMTLSTTIVNNSGTGLGLRSIGDYLVQNSAGYRFAVPAGLDITGRPLAVNWGMQIPGSDWGSPIATAVQAPYVAFVATEPGAATTDSHATIGMMSVDAPTCMVTSDPQDVLGHADLPSFSHQIAVGSLPLPPTGVAAGGSLSYNRRLYLTGGPSSAGSNQTAGIWNTMVVDRYQGTNINPNANNSTQGLWPQDYGTLLFSLSGSAQTQGPLPTEVRVERQVGGSLANPVWLPERVEYQEPGENVVSQTSFHGSSTTALVLVGTYRLVVTNAVGTQTTSVAVNQASGLRPLLEGPIYIYPYQFFSIGGTDILCPEAATIVSEAGTVVRSLYTPHFFSTAPANAPTGSLQPSRIVIKGQGVPDPWMKRSRVTQDYYSAVTKADAIAPGANPGQFQIRAGNEMFGTAFAGGTETRYFWVPNGQSTGQLTDNGNPVISGGTYRAYATQGPLSQLQYLDFTAYDGQGENTHPFIIWNQGLPSGWTTFDLPGPGQSTTGGLLPFEKLASGMAEGVQIIGHTEQDLETDGDGLYNEFTWDFNAAGFNTSQLTAIGSDPFVVGGRTSVLPGYGTVTSLFTPAATRIRYGGAIQPDSWTLADFITQSQGKYVVVHRPRGPQGLFTLMGDPVGQVGMGSKWMSGSGIYAVGTTNGGFDAIELLRAEGFDGTNPDPWFQEFLQVRQDWFGLLNQQTPTHFTKALGLSSAKFSLLTPVGLARTYLQAAPVQTTPILYNSNGTLQAPVWGVPLVQDLSTVLAGLQAGAAVASTGPFLDVTVGATGPGGLVKGPMPTATVNVALYNSIWMPVDEVRIIVNGKLAQTIDPATLAPSASDARLSTGAFQVPMPATGTGAWVVVEAGVRLTQTGPYAVGTPWNFIQRGIYPIAVTNPIFVDVTGNGYTHP